MVIGTRVPDKIGRYEIIEQIGRGSMGTVFSAHDPFSGRQVALKVAHVDQTGDVEQGKRFRKLFFNEAHAASALDHPNIVRVLDADSEGDLFYLVMEYVPGGETLSKYCRPANLLPLRRVVGIIYKIAKALEYAHRHGIIHRDIKPSNFLITEEHDVKLADFSIAMVTQSDAAMTQIVGVIGSPLYMSPEQIKDLNLTGATDIFSLGLVTYQLLTGVHPFKAESFGAITQKVITETPPLITSYRFDAPHSLAYVVKHMLEKSPEDRYSSALDLAGDLGVIFEDLDAVTGEFALRERFSEIKNLGFFKGFSDEDIWELARSCTWQVYEQDKVIVNEGEEDHSFYIMVSGVAEVMKNGTRLHGLQEGDCFGEMGFLTKSRRSASVVAKTDVTVIKVNENTIDRAQDSIQLRFHKAFTRTLISRIQELTDRSI
ncbi:MAG: serine/threonine-protein kinase [Gammaproteobacteria bacterium]|nr:serine/threonine-protein kinase [Gammaproteobacteria bacterium]